ncbi:radial spoke head 14 homolog isoform X1 [Narcine bancroftii]|uniref:radial spoke head 14 homolog isoform X1 n=1 Tax=Narcine bancroftii TaxID=1343680 RepID=UPI0038311420
MSHPRVSAHLPPHVDPTRAPVAFGDGAVPKLRRELADPNLITRQRALMALGDLVHDPELAYTAVEVGCLDNLKHLLKDEDVTVRHKTSEIFYILVTHSIGRFAIIKHEAILPLSDLLNDPVDICRKNVHMAIEMLSEIPAGADAILHAELVPLLIMKLRTELDEIQELILKSLHFCLLVDTKQALDAEGVTVLKAKLTHSSEAIRSLAAQALMDISTPLEGKNKLCEEEVIPILVELLSDPNHKVRAAAAGTLMFATVTTQDSIAPSILRGHLQQPIDPPACTSLGTLEEAGAPAKLQGDPANSTQPAPRSKPGGWSSEGPVLLAGHTNVDWDWRQKGAPCGTPRSMSSRKGLHFRISCAHGWMNDWHWVVEPEYLTQESEEGSGWQLPLILIKGN